MSSSTAGSGGTGPQGPRRGPETAAEAGAAGPSATGPATGAEGERVPATTGLVFDDPLSRPARDDTDEGWGERPGGGGGGASDLARFLDERPPHHL